MLVQSGPLCFQYHDNSVVSHDDFFSAASFTQPCLSSLLPPFLMSCWSLVSLHVQPRRMRRISQKTKQKNPCFTEISIIFHFHLNPICLSSFFSLPCVFSFFGNTCETGDYYVGFRAVSLHLSVSVSVSVSVFISVSLYISFGCFYDFPFIPG